MESNPKIVWDKGCAYDLFISLRVIHSPDDFGLRPSWAAGVRSRLPVALREVLEQSQKFMGVPINWVYELPKPKDVKTALLTLKAIPPQDRLPSLNFTGYQDSESKDDQKFLLSLEGKRRFTEQIEKRILARYRGIRQPPKGYPRALFSAWSDRKGFGEAFAEALEAYINNFFLEEEARILPALDQALTESQALAQERDISSLLEELTSGVRMDWIKEADQLILAPSFWAAPFVLFNNPSINQKIIVFGKRPKGMALVPGEQISDELLNGLKAISDPTRLRILKYLMNQSCTPSELAKILRLRPPTVIHHLHILRLAGFVQVTISSNSERQYAVREDGVLETVRLLHTFLLED